MTLDIIIPTFNRNDKLIALLKIITSTPCYDNVFFKVVDNCSDTPVLDTIKCNQPTLIDNKSLKIYRNASNVGLAGNIMRCFEYAESDWLWIIGDDDAISKESIDLVLSTLNACNEGHGFVNFSSPWSSRTETYNCPSLDSFTLQLDSFKNFIYLPTTVYRTEAIQKHLEIGYKYVHTLIPHFMLQLKVLESGYGCLLCKEDVFRGNGERGSGGWSVLELQLNKSQILNYAFQMSKASYKRLEKLIVLDRQPLKIYAKMIVKDKKHPLHLKSRLIRSIFEENRMLTLSKSHKERLSNMFYYLLSFKLSILMRFLKNKNG